MTQPMLFFRLCLFFFTCVYFSRKSNFIPSIFNVFSFTDLQSSVLRSFSNEFFSTVCYSLVYIHPNISFGIMPPTTSIFASPFYSCLFQIFTPWISTSPVASLNWRSRQRELISFAFLHMVFLAQFHPFYFQFLVIFMRHIWHAMITSILFPYVNIAKLNILHNNFVSPQLLLL